MTQQEIEKECKNGDESAEISVQEDQAMTKDWPLKNIAEPHAHDVLYGRGGGTNHHPGNKRYRKMVEDRKLDYVNCKRLDKPLVALDIIRQWRGQDPPGRFLKMDDKTGLWNDVGDKKAREKTSQALREKAPLIRKAIEDEKHAKDHPDEAAPSGVRFGEGTKAGPDGVTKAMLARDHSLGREIMDVGDAVTLEGFDWQEPFGAGGQRERSGGPPPGGPPPSAQMPPPPMPPQGFPMSSMGSVVSAGSWANGPGGRFHSGSSMSMGPPPSIGPPGAYGPPPRFDSWSSNASFGPIPSVGYGPPPPGAGPPMPTSSWGPRDHSLCGNQLPYASVAQPATYQAFDSRAASGQWGPYPGGPPPPPPPPNAGAPYPGAPPPAQGPPGFLHSSGAAPPPRPPPSPPSPRYNVDPAVAQQWSGQPQEAIARTYSGEGSYGPPPMAPNMVSSGSSGASGQHEMPKPDMVKRMTSNQNETVETRPQVKRAALNRDNSMAANKLKEKYVPGFVPRRKGDFNPEQEMNRLNDTMRQTSIGVVAMKPNGLKDRTSTLESMDLMVKPLPMESQNRSTTIDALQLDFDEPVRGALDRTTTMESVFSELKGEIPKPTTIAGVDRITTTDLFNMVNEPIDGAEEVQAV